jgi:hypothetical protein
MKNRSNVGKRNSGGIALCYKEELSDFIQTVDSESNYVFWCKIDKAIIRKKQDMLLGIIYIPPEGSKFCKDDPYSEVEQEFLKFDNHNHYTCIVRQRVSSDTLKNNFGNL